MEQKGDEEFCDFVGECFELFQIGLVEINGFEKECGTVEKRIGVKVDVIVF